MPCPTKDRLKQASGASVTSLFTRVTNCRGTRVARFFKNDGTEAKNRRNYNKNNTLRVPRGVWDRLGQWDSGTAIS